MISRRALFGLSVGAATSARAPTTTAAQHYGAKMASRTDALVLGRAGQEYAEAVRIGLADPRGSQRQ